MATNEKVMTNREPAAGELELIEWAKVHTSGKKNLVLEHDHRIEAVLEAACSPNLLANAKRMYAELLLDLSEMAREDELKSGRWLKVVAASFRTATLTAR